MNRDGLWYKMKLIHVARAGISVYEIILSKIADWILEGTKMD